MYAKYALRNNIYKTHKQGNTVTSLEIKIYLEL